LASRRRSAMEHDRGKGACELHICVGAHLDLG